jgi:hypothetical protein
VCGYHEITIDSVLLLSLLLLGQQQ